MACFTAMHADAGVAVDDAVRHQYGAGVEDFQAKRAAIESNLVVAIDVSFRRVENRNSHSSVVADDVGSSGCAVSAV